MNERNHFLSYVSTLGALVAIYVVGAVLAWQGKPLEALGLSGVGTGLIGVLGAMARGRQKGGDGDA